MGAIGPGLDTGCASSILRRPQARLRVARQFIEVRLPNCAVKEEGPVAQPVLLNVANIKTVLTEQTKGECTDILLVNDTHVLGFEDYKTVKQKINVAAARNRG